MDFKSVWTILSYVIVFTVAYSLLGFYLAIRPIRITSSITPAALNVPYENVSFNTSDGILIKGWFIPSAKPYAKTIILLHGYPADKGDILPSRLFLHHDYNLLFIDFRYFGESGGHYSTVGKDEVLDLLAAIQYLKTRDINEVGVWGFSLGGSVALMAAAKAPEIKAVVSESAYANLNDMLREYYKIPLLRYPLAMLTRAWAWLFLRQDIKSMSPAEQVKNLHIPILIIHSEDDNVISFRHAQSLKQALAHNKNAQFIFNKNLPHGYPFDNYENTIKSFFDNGITEDKR